VSDQQGSVLAWLNSDSQVLSAYKFLAFGKIVVNDLFSESNPIIYSGQPYEDDIGLYNFRGRLYDPVLRRFISPDPQRQFPSPFVYAGNNPIVNIDPNGEMSKDAIGGLILSIVEIGLAVGTGNYWAVPIGVAGVTNTISHKNDSGKAFWKNYAESEVGVAIGIGEIVAGVALTVFTDGAGGAWGGATLIGAGVSAVSYSTFHEGDFSWNAYAKAQVVGAVGGFITGGFGAAASSLTLTGGSLVAAEVGLGITAGVTSSLSSSLISAAWDHQSVNWKSALINAGISGALGVAGVGAGRLAKGAFGKVANDVEAEVNPIANERTSLLPGNKVTGWKKFVYGENGTVVNQNAAGKIVPNPARIAKLAKPVVFNSKKPVISAVNDYAPKSKEWI
jgi:RHS repeat-associated protein